MQSTNPHLLTKDDLVELTGAKLPDKQAKVLADNRIPFIIRADNKLRTTWYAVNATLVGAKPDRAINGTQKAPIGFHLDKA